MDIISKKLANERLYAYSKGRFWFWDEARNVWKESHLLSKRYGLAHAADGSLTPEDYLTNPVEFQALEEYEVDLLMLDALKNAQPCKNAPIDPVEEPEAANAPAVQEAKPLDAVPDAPAPSFDYSGLDTQTVDTLHMAENQYLQGKKMTETGLRWMVNAVSMAHDALCGGVVPLWDNGDSGACATVAQAHNNQHSESNFRAWCETIGISRSSAYNLLRVAERFGNIQLDGKSILDVQPATLLYEAAKPSAPEEMVEQVKSGDITSNKQYQDALKQLKAKDDELAKTKKSLDHEISVTDQLEEEKGRLLRECEASRKARMDAETRLKNSCIAEQNAREAMQAAEAQRDAALADVDGLKKRVDAAEAREEEAWKMREKAEEALKHQPIAGVVDEEEVDRRAHQQAYSIAADMTEELKADKDKLLQDKAELEKQLAEARAVVPADLVADKETADNCYLNIDGVWAMALPSFQRLVGTGDGSDFNHAAGNLIQLCERIRESLVKMTIANDKETLYE